MDHTERGQQWLQEILQAMGYSGSVTVKAGEEGSSEESTWLVVASEGLEPLQQESLLGERGEPLDALQYLANAVLNLETDRDNQHAFTVDFAGHRQKRWEELLAIAERAAIQVKELGEPVEVKGLNAFERRQLHQILADYSEVESFSRGQEPERHLVVQQQTAEADKSPEPDC